MKYNIGDIVEDEDKNRGHVCILWDLDGDLTFIENDAAHPNPKVREDKMKTENETSDVKKAFTGWIPKKFIDNLKNLDGFYVLDNIYRRRKGVRPAKVRIMVEVIDSKSFINNS